MASRDTKQEQIEREQEYIYEKGQEVVEAVRKVREGDVKAEIPSTEQVARLLQEGEETLQHFQQTERGHQLGPKGQQVIEDIKRVLEDERRIVVEKNEGDVIQNILRHMWGLFGSLSTDPTVGGLFENWRRIASALASSSDWRDLFQSGGELVKNLRDTEAFLELVSELLNLLKVLVAEKAEQITEGKPEALTEYRRQKETEREKIINDLANTMRTLSTNETWKHMVKKGKTIAERAEGASQEVADTTADAIVHILQNPNFQQLITDFKIVLQRAVGEQMSVDPLFDYSKAALSDVLENERLASLLYELQDTLSQVVDNPALIDDPFIRDRLNTLGKRAETLIQELRNSPNVLRAREESQKLADAIMKEPTNLQLIEDSKKLWQDIMSERPGELFDPELLASIRQMIVPLFLEHLDNVPVPPIHDTTDFLGKYDYSLENIKISVPALIPDNIHLRFEYEFDAQPMQLTTSNQRSFVYLLARDIHLHLKNVKWTYHRQSVPRLSDSGFVDVDTQGHGMAIWMRMELRADPTHGHVLDVLETHCHIDRFRVKFMESKHDKFYEMMTHLFAGRIKRDVEKIIEEKMKEFGSYFNQQLITLIQEAREKSQEYSRIAKEKAQGAQQTLAEAMSQMKIQAGETAERAKQVAQEWAQHPAAQQSKEGMKERTKQMVERAQEKVEQAITQQQRRLEEERASKHSQPEQQGKILATGASAEIPQQSFADTSSKGQLEESKAPQLPTAAPSQFAPMSDTPPTSTFGPNPVGMDTSSSMTYGIHPHVPSFAHEPVSIKKTEEAEREERVQQTTIGSSGM